MPYYSPYVQEPNIARRDGIWGPVGGAALGAVMWGIDKVANSNFFEQSINGWSVGPVPVNAISLVVAAGVTGGFVRGLFNIRYNNDYIPG